MTEVDVLVIGAGPAGLAAATQVSRAGLAVEIIEQRTTIGGAIYRQPVDGVDALPQTGAAHRRWRALHDEFRAQGVPVNFASVFLGVEGDGKVLVEDRNAAIVRRRSVKAVIFAIGAVEKVAPRPGWHLAGVVTAGGLQVMMKETGRPPAGRVLLAGSGPLLVAIAAQMVKLGNPPIAIVEAGNPFLEIGAGLSLAAYPGVVGEALGYMWTVQKAGVPWLRSATLRNIRKRGERLSATVQDSTGQEKTYEVDRIGLHDGIRPNDFGLSPERAEAGSSPIIVHAGDCREALGAEAAIADGRNAGQAVARLLSGRPVQDRCELDGFRRAQDILSRIFSAKNTHATGKLASLPDDTVLCRCENRTIADLKQLCGQADPLTGREVKHNGRFSMGACQGRFCAANTAALMAELRLDGVSPTPRDLTGQRWPIRPVPIGALIAAGQDQNTPSRDDQRIEEA